MGLLYEIECAKCGHRDVLEQKRREYALDDGSRLAVDTGLAWCVACGRVVESELFESVGGLKRAIEELEKAPPAGDRFSDLTGMTRDEEISDLRRRLAWRVGRKGAPRCLECGHEDPEFMTMDQKAQSVDGSAGRFRVVHPSCAGRVTARVVGAREDLSAAVAYSPEGVRLP